MAALEQVPGCPFLNPNDCPFNKGGSVRHGKAGLSVNPDDPAWLSMHRSFHARTCTRAELPDIDILKVQDLKLAELAPNAGGPAPRAYEAIQKAAPQRLKASKPGKRGQNEGQEPPVAAAQSATLHAEVSELQATVASLRLQVAAGDAARREQAALHEEKTAALGEQRRLEAGLATLQATVEGLRRENGALKERLAEQQRSLQAAEGRLARGQQECAQHEQRLEESRKLLEWHAGALAQLRAEVDQQRKTAVQESIEAEWRQYAAAAAEWERERERERERHRQVVEALQQCIDDLRRRLVSAGQANSPLRITAGPSQQSPEWRTEADISPQDPRAGQLVQHDLWRVPPLPPPPHGRPYIPERSGAILRPEDFGAVPITLGYLLAMKSAFKAADADQTGVLDVASLGEYCQRMGLKEVSYGQLMKMMDAADPTGMGTIDFFSFLGIQLYLTLNLKARNVHLRDWVTFCNFGKVIADDDGDAADDDEGEPPGWQLEAPGPAYGPRRGSNRMRSALEQHLANAAVISAEDAATQPPEPAVDPESGASAATQHI